MNYRQEKKYNVVEFLKKDCKEWLNNSDSNSSEYIGNRPIRLKTLPEAHGKEINKVIADLKAALPELSPIEVRRFHMPYHEAILLELEEQGYQEAFYYIKELLEMDEKIANKTPGMVMWKKAYLKNQNDFINCLKDGLVTSEMGKRKGDYVTQAISLLDTALLFQSKTWEWWWVTERLYQTALSAAELIKHDNGQTITLIRYLYGRFLFHELQNPKEALEYLNKAREVSENQIWNASKKLGVKQNSIFKETNVLLYKALLILARKERTEKPNFALNACIEALERANNAENAEYVNETLYELGKSYVAVGDIKMALQSFSKLLAIAKRISDIEGICNAHMELAFAYKQLNENDHTEKHLRMCRENAEDFGLIQKLADAHYYTGEHYLSQGKLHLSTVHLETALSLYNRLDLSCDADRARSIAGISKGQERIDKYIHLLLRCGQYDKNATLKLCRWKSRREPFWTEETHNVTSDMEIQYENSDTLSSSLSYAMDNDRSMSRP
ncbi:Tetratricopeptide repeat protein 29 [Habropoda laboriosa]|uniref:Tetratricopeptide repeat protein 29 n=1 Tax=Habropoda laboriosa TaxID=597456 RepID=A0A0L7RD52_9HYME|nr:Tetratricopeptide repeat protein 29 [Habropoda laboriosa]